MGFCERFGSCLLPPILLLDPPGPIWGRMDVSVEPPSRKAAPNSFRAFTSAPRRHLQLWLGALHTTLQKNIARTLSHYEP